MRKFAVFGAFYTGLYRIGAIYPELRMMRQSRSKSDGSRMRMDHPDDDTKAASEKGRDGASRTSAAQGLVPWAATAEARRKESPSRLRRFVVAGSRAVVVAVGLGLGAAAAHFAFSDPSLLQTILAKTIQKPSSPPESLAGQTTDVLDELRSEIADLRVALARDHDEAGSVAAKKKLDDFAARFEKATRDSGAFAELAAKIDPLLRETSARLQGLAERLDRLERRIEAAAEPVAKPTQVSAEPHGAARDASNAAEAARNPPIIKGWILREVYDGVALVEGAGGAVEVAPGETLPGAGRVKSIERKGHGWIVVTSRGVIDHGPPRFDPR
jgi:hypothetical protein